LFKLEKQVVDMRSFLQKRSAATF